MLYAAVAMVLGAGARAHAGGDIEAPGLDGPLRGTMILPAKDAPVILMIPGSGPTDQDVNSLLGIRPALYRLLAEGLAGQGIGSVRIDKRGMFESRGAVPDDDAVTIADYALRPDPRCHVGMTPWQGPQGAAARQLRQCAAAGCSRSGNRQIVS